jgi:hypothetical protein
MSNIRRVLSMPERIEKQAWIPLPDLERGPEGVVKVNSIPRPAPWLRTSYYLFWMHEQNVASAVGTERLFFDLDVAMPMTSAPTEVDRLAVVMFIKD